MYIKLKPWPKNLPPNIFKMQSLQILPFLLLQLLQTVYSQNSCCDEVVVTVDLAKGLNTDIMGIYSLEVLLGHYENDDDDEDDYDSNNNDDDGIKDVADDDKTDDDDFLKVMNGEELYRRRDGSYILGKLGHWKVETSGNPDPDGAQGFIWVPAEQSSQLACPEEAGLVWQYYGQGVADTSITVQCLPEPGDFLGLDLSSQDILC